MTKFGATFIVTLKEKDQFKIQMALLQLHSSKILQSFTKIHFHYCELDYSYALPN